MRLHTTPLVNGLVQQLSASSCGTVRDVEAKRSETITIGYPNRMERFALSVTPQSPPSQGFATNAAGEQYLATTSVTHAFSLGTKHELVSCLWS